MKVGDLVKCVINDYPHLGVVTKVNQREVSHIGKRMVMSTYMVLFATINRTRWCQDFELEVINESR